MSGHAGSWGSLLFKPDFDGVMLIGPYAGGPGIPGDGGEPGAGSGKEGSLAAILVQIYYFEENVDPIASRWIKWEVDKARRKLKIREKTITYLIRCWEKGVPWANSAYKAIRDLMGDDQRFTFKLVLGGETRVDTTVKITKLGKAYESGATSASWFRRFQVSMQESLIPT